VGASSMQRCGYGLVGAQETNSQSARVVAERLEIQTKGGFILSRVPSCPLDSRNAGREGCSAMAAKRILPPNLDARPAATRIVPFYGLFLASC
jgi:hypothetical protein